MKIRRRSAKYGVGSNASTGQDFLGCNMFAYCLNNPVIAVDSSGSAAKVCLTDDTSLVLMKPTANPGGGGGLPIDQGDKEHDWSEDYILNQETSEVSGMRFGASTVAMSGCGAVAIYNYLTAVGANEDMSYILFQILYRATYNVWSLGGCGMMPSHLIIEMNCRRYYCSVSFGQSAIDDAMATGKPFIVWYTHSEGMHFTTFVQHDGNYYSLNRYSNSTGPRLENDSSGFSNNKIVIVIMPTK